MKELLLIGGGALFGAAVATIGIAFWFGKNFRW